MSFAERRKHNELTEEQLQRLKEELRREIKEEILDDLFAEIGRTVVSRFLWACGILLTAVLAYLGFTGKIIPPK